MRIPRKKKGIVYFVGNAARFVITTIVSETIAPNISPNEAPLCRITAMVKGKNIAVMIVTVIPTQPI